MRNHSIFDSLIWMGAIVFAITILSAAGAAVFALLCGTLGWVLHVDRMPIGFLWATTSGAIGGFLMGIMWAIDRMLNWQSFLSRSRHDSRASAVTSVDDEVTQETALEKLPK